MKITIKVDHEALFILHSLVKNRVKIETAERVSTSILSELYKKITASCLSYQLNPNGKARNITMWYHTANELYALLCSAFVFLPNADIFIKNKIDSLKNQIHQKLL